MPDRCSTAFQAAGWPFVNVYLILVPTCYFSIVARKPFGKAQPVVGSAVASAELSFAEKDISGSRRGAFRKSSLSCMWRSSSKYFSVGEEHCPAKGWCWENMVETGAVQAPVLQAAQELIWKHDFYTFGCIKQPCKVLSQKLITGV